MDMLFQFLSNTGYFLADYRHILMLAVGSTLSVFPAANAVPRAKAGGAPVIIVNGEETAMDRYADHLLVGQIGEILPELIAEPG